MIDIDKLKEDRKIALKKLDDPIDSLKIPLIDNRGGDELINKLPFIYDCCDHFFILSLRKNIIGDMHFGK